MDILVIGNGFDLAHGLPTKYTDFLEWIKAEYVYFYDLKREGAEIVKEISQCISNEYHIPDSSKIKVIRLDDESKQQEIWKCIDDNIWIDYFISNLTYQKENWIDFENEISKVIQQLDGDMLCLDGQRLNLTDDMDNLSNDYLRKKYSECTFSIRSINEFTNKKSKTITYKEIRDRLYKDLNRLIRALEIYLIDYVGNKRKQCTIISPDIKGLKIDSVLSFNYTDTYMQLYDLEEKSEYDYIHGKADIKNTIDSNNMVLGIDEYLPDDRKNKDVEFVAFKKFYQRIHKQTGCKYREWIDEIKKDYLNYQQRKIEAEQKEQKYIPDKLQKAMNQYMVSAIKGERCKQHNLYIFGHSLDVTDKDILRDLILNDNVHTTIFYLNKDVMGQQIANLVKVIGQDELIKRTGGSAKTIEFKQQQDMVNIKE